MAPSSSNQYILEKFLDGFVPLGKDRTGREHCSEPMPHGPLEKIQTLAPDIEVSLVNPNPSDSAFSLKPCSGHGSLCSWSKQQYGGTLSPLEVTVYVGNCAHH